MPRLRNPNIVLHPITPAARPGTPTKRVRPAGDAVTTASVTIPILTADALCAQFGPEMFFPKVGHNAAAAKRICQVCPVRSECLQWALDNNEQAGIWGGTSPAEREQLAKAQRPDTGKVA